MPIFDIIVDDAITRDMFVVLGLASLIAFILVVATTILGMITKSRNDALFWTSWAITVPTLLLTSIWSFGTHSNAELVREEDIVF
jgi:hypothetical protein